MRERRRRRGGGGEGNTKCINIHVCTSNVPMVRQFPGWVVRGGRIGNETAYHVRIAVRERLSLLCSLYIYIYIYIYIRVTYKQSMRLHFIERAEPQKL